MPTHPSSFTGQDVLERDALTLSGRGLEASESDTPVDLHPQEQSHFQQKQLKLPDAWKGEGVRGSLPVCPLRAQGLRDGAAQPPSYRAGPES